MRSDAFKKASLQLHSNNFGLKQLSTTIKTFITMTMECKAILEL